MTKVSVKETSPELTHNYVYLHKMYYDKFELGGTYEGSIETKECKQKVPSEKW